ncbi:hypothetical protein M9Y10_028791 [Tritrichomonas musculus]|uniref:Uncharacterized protein n=1 Tax=Tritrichomonas musculus TaxID=1915356 RepID=A0ABR2KKA4_9EUKA
MDDGKKDDEKDEKPRIFIPQSPAEFESERIKYPKYPLTMLPYISPVKVKSPSQRFRERWSILNHDSHNQNNYNIADSDADIFDFSDDVSSTNSSLTPPKKWNNEHLNNNDKPARKDNFQYDDPNSSLFSGSPNSIFTKRSQQNQLSPTQNKQAKYQSYSDTLDQEASSNIIQTPKFKIQSQQIETDSSQSKNSFSRISQLRKEFEDDFPPSTFENDHYISNSNNSINKHFIIEEEETNDDKISSSIISNRKNPQKEEEKNSKEKFTSKRSYKNNQNEAEDNVQRNYFSKDENKAEFKYANNNYENQIFSKNDSKEDETEIGNITITNIEEEEEEMEEEKRFTHSYLNDSAKKEIHFLDEEENENESNSREEKESEIRIKQMNSTINNSKEEGSEMQIEQMNSNINNSKEEEEEEEGGSIKAPNSNIDYFEEDEEEAQSKIKNLSRSISNDFDEKEEEEENKLEIDISDLNSTNIQKENEEKNILTESPQIKSQNKYFDLKKSKNQDEEEESQTEILLQIRNQNEEEESENEFENKLLLQMKNQNEEEENEIEDELSLHIKNINEEEEDQNTTGNNSNVNNLILSNKSNNNKKENHFEIKFEDFEEEEEESRIEILSQTADSKESFHKEEGSDYEIDVNIVEAYEINEEETSFEFNSFENNSSSNIEKDIMKNGKSPERKSKESFSFTTPKIPKVGDSFLESSMLDSNPNQLSDTDNK